ncbi:MAG: hypothetical protein ACRBN8_32405 [Nannocystales bacterium]
MRTLLIGFLVLTSLGCGVTAEDGWHAFGAVDGALVTLSSDSRERGFVGELCRAAPDEVEIDVRLGAWVTSSQSVAVEATLTTPDEEYVETIMVDGRTRLGIDDTDTLLDPELACSEGVGVRFALPDEAADVEIQWVLHYGFRADEELVDTRVELMDAP